MSITDLSEVEKFRFRAWKFIPQKIMYLAAHEGWDSLKKNWSLQEMEDFANKYFNKPLRDETLEPREEYIEVEPEDDTA